MNSSRPGWRLKVIESVESTSDYCLALARSGETEMVAVLTGIQKRGRGSRGRKWDSSPGNLALSVLLRPSCIVSELGQWALVAGVVFFDVLQPYSTDLPVTLKWPNDILVDGAKVGGILIDASADASGHLEWLVIGFGANLCRAPVFVGRRSSHLIKSPAPSQVTATLLKSIDLWRQIWIRDGFSAIRRAWIRRGHAFGAPLTARFGPDNLNGTFLGLSEDGSLLLRVGRQIRHVRAGEVSILETGRTINKDPSHTFGATCRPYNLQSDVRV